MEFKFRYSRNRCWDTKLLESSVEDSVTKRTVLLKTNPIYKGCVKKEMTNKL